MNKLKKSYLVLGVLGIGAAMAGEGMLQAAPQHKSAGGHAPAAHATHSGGSARTAVTSHATRAATTHRITTTHRATTTHRVTTTHRATTTHRTAPTHRAAPAWHGTPIQSHAIGGGWHGRGTWNNGHYGYWNGGVWVTIGAPFFSGPGFYGSPAYTGGARSVHFHATIQGVDASDGFLGVVSRRGNDYNVQTPNAGAFAPGQTVYVQGTAYGNMVQASSVTPY